MDELLAKAIAASLEGSRYCFATIIEATLKVRHAKPVQKCWSLRMEAHGYYWWRSQ